MYINHDVPLIELHIPSKYEKFIIFQNYVLLLIFTKFGIYGYVRKCIIRELF